MQEIKRDLYLNKLINRRENGMIKIITGIRRCGKSYLLDPIYKDYLLSTGVKEDHIIKLALDREENRKYHDASELNKYIKAQVKDKDMYYIILDEIQMCENAITALKFLAQNQDFDCIASGSLLGITYNRVVAFPIG